MGGEIGVDSVPGQGSTFWFTVPFGYAEAPFWDDRLVVAQALRNRHVLIVDDNDVNRWVFEKQLSGPGMTVVSVSNGAAALKALADATRKRPELSTARIDHMMPEMDGVELAKRIRARPEYRALGLVLCSSSGLFTNGHSAKEFGFTPSSPNHAPQTALLRTSRQPVARRITRRYRAATAHRGPADMGRYYWPALAHSRGRRPRD